MALRLEHEVYLSWIEIHLSEIDKSLFRQKLANCQIILNAASRARSIQINAMVKLSFFNTK